MKRLFLAVGLTCLHALAWAADVPTITLPPTKSTVFQINQNADLWFFNGQSPDNYATSIVINSVGPTEGQFTWTIKSGSTTATLENNGQTITQSNAPAVGVNSTGASAAPKDIGIEFKFNGQNVGTYQLSSFAPTSVRQEGPTSHNAVNTFTRVGFESIAQFSIRDQFGDEIPREMPINEVLVTSSRVNDYPDTNWPNGTPFSTTQRRFFDHWLFDELFPFAPFGSIPHPTNPQNPLSGTKVYHYPQQYFAGSTQFGLGRQIEVHNLQMFVDHGDIAP